MQVEEFYVITWDAKKEQIFEMPTGGAAIMRKGPNLIKFAKKEQCLALTTQLRTKFKTDACFYRVYPDGSVQYLHPADGVYPEKVNAGRERVNTNMRRIGQNVNPIQVRCSAPVCLFARLMKHLSRNDIRDLLATSAGLCSDVASLSW
jgi:photosystem I subunit 2